MALGALFPPPGLASLESATTGTGRAFAANNAKQIAWKTTYTTAPTTGTAVIEQATSHDYAGTWNLLDTISCANLSAGTEGFGTFPGEIDFVRARITSNPDQAISVYFNFLGESN